MENKQTMSQLELAQVDVPLEQNEPSEPVKLIKQCPDFLRVFKGQTVSVFGSQMVAFAFSIWIYQQTQSLIHFGLVISAQLLPTLVLAPVAGALCDKYSRRKIMLFCELGLTLVSGLLCVLAFKEQLNVTNILLISPLIASFSSVHQIAYSASVSQLVPKTLYARANGFVQSGIHLSAVIIPTISVGLLETVGLAYIMLISIFTYLMSAMSLLFSDFPYLGKTSQKMKKLDDSIKKFKPAIVSYLMKNRGAMSLITFLCMVSFLNGIVLVLFRPMILTTLSSITLGWMVTFAGIGGLMGAILAGKLAARDDRIKVLMLATMTSGFTMAFCGQLTNTWLISILVFVYSFSAPIALVVAQTILQTITPVDFQGRVFAARTFFSTLAMILAVGVAPVAAELYFEPMMLAGQPWA
ncbi:MAG: MFS transporter, partial [Algicola sp.]|nr:MFS transporter [Algicola sp.]